MFSSVQHVRNKQRKGEIYILQPRNEKKELERAYWKCSWKRNVYHGRRKKQLQAVAGHVSAGDMARADQEGGSASRRLGLSSWRLSRTVCFYDRQSVSVTGCLCLRQTVCDRHSLCLSQTGCVCNTQSVSFTDSVCLSQTLCVCHRLYVSITGSMCLSHTVCVCHRQIFLVTNNLCLSQNRQSLYVTDTLLVHSWPSFCLFIHDVHQDLSVKF